MCMVCVVCVCGARGGVFITSLPAHIVRPYLVVKEQLGGSCVRPRRSIHQCAHSIAYKDWVVLDILIPLRGLGWVAGKPELADEACGGKDSCS